MILSKYLKIPKTLNIPVGAETLKIEYLPSRYTVGFQKTLSAMVNDENASTGDFFSAILGLLVGWDLTDDDGKEVPINKETMEMLPIALLYTIAQGIQGDANGIPKPVEKSGSFS